MREIKYRAWLKNQKIIVDVQELHFYNNTMAHILDNYIDGEQEWIDEDFDDYELMQYTGLNDKNSVEIYEGYIVNVEINDRLDWDSMTGKVVFLEGSWFVEDVGNFAIPLWSEMNEIEIIGNIYENPELLEEME